MKSTSSIKETLYSSDGTALEIETVKPYDRIDRAIIFAIFSETSSRNKSVLIEGIRSTHDSAEDLMQYAIARSITAPLLSAAIERNGSDIIEHNGL